MLLAVGLLAVTAVAAVGVAVRQGMRQEFLRFQEVEQQSTLAAGVDRAHAIVTRLESGANLSDAVAALPPTLAAFVIDEARGQFIAAAGTSVSQVGPVTTTRQGALLQIETTIGRGQVLNRIALKLHQEGVPFRWSDGRAARLYVIPFPSEVEERRTRDFLGSIDRQLLLVTGLVAALALVVTWTLARRTVRPIGELRAAARDLGKGDLARRVSPRGQDEVAELGRAFNTMAAELERQQALRRALVHDVVHELRTPLTAVRCRVETIVDGLADDPARALADVREDVLHLSRLVDDLQELALAEARELRLDIGPVAVETGVDSALRAAGLERDTRVRLELPLGLIVRADAVRLRQMLINLLTNAGRHTPADGTITIRATAAAETVAIAVENTGSTLDDEQIGRIFDRFYRTDAARDRGAGGTGLGLAVVKHLAETQGGHVWARANATSVTVGIDLPLAGSSLQAQNDPLSPLAGRGLG